MNARKHQTQPRVIGMIFCFGGAFNPPTLAHKKIYETIKNKYPLTRFIFLPVGPSYEKEMAPAGHRLAMLKRMTQGDEFVAVEDLELQDASYQGAFYSLKRLEEKYDQPVIFVLGMDHAASLLTWKKADQLLRHHQFLVIRRPGVSPADLAAVRRRYPNAIYDILDLDIDISSTAYRTTHDPRLVDPSVHQYIKDHHLYEEASWQD